MAPNFYLYIDEFQNLANDSFADILSQSRKYKLNLTIAHQYIEQMPETVRAAVFGNVGTTIMFRIGATDAAVMEQEFAEVFTVDDMVRLGIAQVYMSLMIDGVGSTPFSARTLPPIEKPAIDFRPEVIDASRKSYSKSRAEVEQQIASWMGPELKPKEQPKTWAEIKKEKKEREARKKAKGGAGAGGARAGGGQNGRRVLPDPRETEDSATEAKAEKAAARDPEMLSELPGRSSFADALSEIMKGDSTASDREERPEAGKEERRKKENGEGEDGNKEGGALAGPKGPAESAAPAPQKSKPASKKQNQKPEKSDGLGDLIAKLSQN